MGRGWLVKCISRVPTSSTLCSFHLKQNYFYVIKLTALLFCVHFCLLTLSSCCQLCLCSMAAISTAVSDLALAISSFYSAYVLWISQPQHANGYYAMLIIGLAASLGVFRFGLTNPCKFRVMRNLLISSMI